MNDFLLSPLGWVAVAVIGVALAAALSKRFPATGALLLANVVVFLLELGQPSLQDALALHGDQLVGLHAVGFLQLLTSMFAHLGFLHILGNMVFLWAFGVPFEERIGARRFVAIYLVSGLVGSLVQAWALHAEGLPWLFVQMLGASGAIFGIMCAFAAKYPNQVIAVPLMFIFMRTRVVFGALFWLALEVMQVVVRDPTSQIGHFAHLAGGAAGALLAVTLLRHVVPKGKGGPIAIDLVALGDFAHDGATKDVLSHMRQNHDEPEVFQAWLDRFFRTATCPTCKHRVMPRHRGEVVCTQGHTFDVRQDKRGKLAPTA